MSFIDYKPYYEPYYDAKTKAMNFKQPMRTNFQDIDVSQWLSLPELIGFLTELNMVEATYKSVEVPVPAHFDLKRQEITSAIKIARRVETLKEVVSLETQLANMRTPEEQRADIQNQVVNLKRFLGVESDVKKIEGA